MFITKNPYDTGDSIMHYLYARFAPKHPLNLMHSWAKPLFTLLAMGPAQLGYRGIMLWQCGLVAASAWLSYRVAERLGVPYAALAILLCYTAPDYFRIQFSGLTEPLFGFVLIASVALLVAQKPGWSAALVSWLPFVRSEGFILLGLWVVYLVWQRQWRALPGLLLGYVLYSIVGGIVLGDFGWVFGRNAYPTISTYGHGDWKTYLVGLLYLMGWIMAVLVALGGVQLVWRASRKASWADSLFRAELLVVYGAVAVFVAAHTLFWVFGLFGSAGLTRVLTVLTPLLAIIALRGLSGLLALGHTVQAQQRIALAVAGLAVAFLFTGLRMEMQWVRDFGSPGDVTLAEQAATWYRQLPGPRRPVSLESAAAARALDLDMFDYQARPLASIGGKLQLEQLPVGTLVFWDSWFSPMEGGLPLDRLQNDAHFRQRWAGSAYGHANDPNSGTCQLIVFEKVKQY
ncbi:hypothetical protein J4D99_08735 [Siccationidurans ginsengisoli]|uniref:hypothetical protein n=1 Tax=Hymenobacter TaxID=89966 RepID=UPI001AACDD07|nr:MULTISPECIES: hypothetical protein [unclassified Hymenobacter]MBO2031468.1 hypothetical protein [Hymenobacter sp. BT559]